MVEFATEAVGGAEGLVEAITDGVEGEIPGAGVVNLTAAEGFLVLGEAVPGVVGVAGSGDAPEIKGGLAGGFGVNDHLDEENGAGDEFAVGLVGGGVGVVADAGVVVDEGGGDGDGLRELLVVNGEGVGVELGDVEGGEAGFELVLEVGGGLGNEMIAGADAGEEVGEDGDFGGVLSLADDDAFFGVVAPETGFFFFHIGKEVGFGLGEVENPGVGGVEIVGFLEVKGGGVGEGEGGLKADEDGVMLGGEAAESVEGEGEVFGGRFGEGGAVGTVEVVANWGVLEDGEGVVGVAVEAKGGFAFEFLVGFPSG